MGVLPTGSKIYGLAFMHIYVVNIKSFTHNFRTSNSAKAHSCAYINYPVTNVTDIKEALFFFFFLVFTIQQACKVNDSSVDLW